MWNHLKQFIFSIQITIECLSLRLLSNIFLTVSFNVSISNSFAHDTFLRLLWMMLAVLCMFFIFSHSVLKIPTIIRIQNRDKNLNHTFLIVSCVFPIDSSLEYLMQQFFSFLVLFISIFFSRSLTFYFILFSCSLNSNLYMCCVVSRYGIYVWNRLRCHSSNLLSIQSMNLHFYFDNNSNGMLKYLCVCSLERYSNPKNKIKFWILVIRNHVDDLIVKSGRIENKNEQF